MIKASFKVAFISMLVLSTCVLGLVDDVSTKGVVTHVGKQIRNTANKGRRCTRTAHCIGFCPTGKRAFCYFGYCICV
ncbi:unnamed protein product [Lactuca virosa]|uniref:Uncharacterized protein n=1 Tax=Lactuca virosa TaxID=75947 RepID=A0AAU9NEJ7_9ASTR|nr:unnamed protein product [Lactuca virosa]